MGMLPQLQSERQLAAVEAASMPHLTASSQRDVISRITRNIGDGEPPVRATESGLAAIGITVERVSAAAGDGTSRDDTKGEA